MHERCGPILLVEDDLSLRDSLCQFLEDSGYATVGAGSTAEGWQRLHSDRPWLCLLDLNLPDGSGLDLLNKIVRGRINVRVVVMTAFDLQHLRPAGASDVLAGWLSKPLSPVDLLKIVEAEAVRRTVAGRV